MVEAGIDKKISEGMAQHRALLIFVTFQAFSLYKVVVSCSADLLGN